MARLSALLPGIGTLVRSRDIKSGRSRKSNALSLPRSGLVVSTFGALAQQAKPQYGEWGYDISGADKTTKPGDDFFRYANGN
jgi:hypothetical protein